MLSSLARSVLCAVLVACIASARLSAQCRDFAPGIGLFNTQVNALESYDAGAGPRLYAGGLFVGPTTNVLYSWNGSAWSAAATANSIYGTIYSLCVYDDGSGPALFAGGFFNNINGVAAANIAKFDGVHWTALSSGTDATVRAMAVHDDGTGSKLYVGGDFLNAGGLSTPRIARWNGATWEAVGALAGGGSAGVYALKVFDAGGGPKLYAAGNFTLYLRRWNGSTWVGVGGGLYGQTAPSWSLAVHDDGTGSQLIVGGMFTLGGVQVNLVRWNGSVLSTYAELPSNPITALGVYDDGAGERLFVAGPNSIGGTTVNRIARWDGSSWSPLGLGFDISGFGSIRTMRVHDDGSGPKLFMGGVFKYANGVVSDNVARYGEPCSPLAITTQPQDVTTTIDNHFTGVNFQVVATGTQVIDYQWRRNSVPINDGLDVSGAHTPALHMTFWNAADAGNYDCVLTNPLGSLTSDAAGLTVPLGPSGSAWEYAPLVYPPQPIDNIPGATYTNASAAEPSSSGSVAFLGNSSVAPFYYRNISQWNAGTTRAIFQEHDPAPGCEPGTVFETGLVHEFDAISGGRAVMNMGLSGYTLPNGGDAIYFDDGTNPSLIARSGEAAPGGAAGETWRLFSFARGSDAGTVLFTGHVFQGAASLGTAAWTWDAINGAQTQLRTNHVPPGANVNLLGVGTYRINRAGEIAVIGTLNSQTGYSNNPTSDNGLWSGMPGNLQLIAQSGDLAPGFGPNDNLEYFSFIQIANNGDVVFISSIAGPGGFGSIALYRWSQGTLTLLLKRGDPAPDAFPGTTFYLFRPVGVNSAGDVVINGDLMANCLPCPTRGLYFIHNATVSRIVSNAMDPLPGAPTNFEFQSTYEMCLNELGQAVFQVYLSYGNSANAVYGWSLARGLFPIAVPSWQVHFQNGQFKTLYYASILGGTYSSLPEEEIGCIDDAGDVTLTLQFGEHAAKPGVFRGNFNYFAGLYFGPGDSVCSGDGSGTPCPCGNVGASDRGCANSTGTGARLDATGSVRVGADDLMFSGSSMPVGISALLFQGPHLLGGGNGVPFHDGLKCVGAPTRNFTIQQTDGAGAASWGPGLATLGQWAAGDTRYFQAWYRDKSGSPCTSFSNLTNALRVVFAP